MSNTNTNPNTSNKLFATPFSPAYWQAASKDAKKLRNLMIAALFIALRIIIASFYIPLGENLNVYFGFFVNALGAMIYGPVLALGSGFVCDILEFVLHPSPYGFFFGYTITAMLGSFFYAIFFYRTRISMVKIFCCKLCVNVFVNIGLGALWNYMLMGKGYLYYLGRSIIKNIVMIPIETILLILFLQLMLPITARAKLTPPQPEKRIPFI